MREYLKDLYKEIHRPQLHFSTIRGWINDPNGLVYYDGEYHLYFQHYPFGYYWGQPHWGHAVSTDLVHWKQLPDVLYRHELGGIYSGSSVVDYKNTSGFKLLFTLQPDPLDTAKQTVRTSHFQMIKA
jgi:sucrose-6-phosphate hydrolase SacC (GH32 family)